MESNLREMFGVAKDAAKIDFKELLDKVAYVPNGELTDLVTGFVGTTSRMAVLLTALTSSTTDNFVKLGVAKDKESALTLMKVFLAIAVSMSLRVENREIVEALYGEEITAMALNFVFPQEVAPKGDVLKVFLENLNKSGVLKPVTE